MSFELALARNHISANATRPITITLPDPDPDAAAAFVGLAIERYSCVGVSLSAVEIEPGLAIELGLGDGDRLPRGDRPVVRHRPGLGAKLRLIRTVSERSLQPS